MRSFFSVTGWAVFLSATASYSGAAECAEDDISMLQVPSQHDARAELLALQKQVYELSEIEATQIELIGGFVGWAGGDQVTAVQRLPQLLRDLPPVRGYFAAMTRAQSIGSQLMTAASSASDIQRDSSSPAQAVMSFLQTYQVALQETTRVAEDFPDSGENRGILAEWCPGMHIMAQHVSELFANEGLQSNSQAQAEAGASLLQGEQHVALLQGVDMKQLQTQKLSEEQSVALKQQLQAARTALSTQEVFIQRVGDAFVRFCTEDVAQNCPPIEYPILSYPLRNMVERCVDTFGQVKALGRLGQ